MRNSTPDEKSLNAEGIHGNDLVKGIYSALESSQIYDLFSNYNWDGLNTDEPKSDEYYEAYGYSDNENSFKEFNPDNYNPDVYSIYEYNPMIEDVYEDYEPAATIKPNYAGIKQSPVEERMIVNRGRRGGKGKRNGRQGRSGKGRDGRILFFRNYLKFVFRFILKQSMIRLSFLLKPILNHYDFRKEIRKQ